jgi:hypothetical protein
MTECPAENTEDVLQEAHLLALRGEPTRARLLLSELIRREPDNQEAIVLLDRVRIQESEHADRDDDRLVNSETVRYYAGRGLQVLGWLCAITALWFVATVINPTRFNKYPQRGQVPVEWYYYREHFPISEPLRLGLALPLLLGGAGLYFAGKRVARTGWDCE